MKTHSRKRNLSSSRTFVYDNLESRKVLASMADFNLNFPTGDSSAEVIIVQAQPDSASAEVSLVSTGEIGADQPIVEAELLFNRSGEKVIDDKGGSQGPALMMDARIANVHAYYQGSDFASGPNGFFDAIDYSRLFAVETESEHILDASYVSNYAKGINALLLNVELLASPGLTTSDFRFQWSPQGNFDVNSQQNLPQNWEDVPFGPASISVEPYSSSMTRVRLNWLDNQIENRWLRMTIKATATTGLAQDEVYYHGHLMGDLSSHRPSNDPGQPFGRFHVNNLTDVVPLRRALGDFVEVSDRMDVNKNSFIEVLDLQLVRSNLNKSLSNIKIVSGPPQRARIADADQEDASTGSEITAKGSTASVSVDPTLSTWYSIALKINDESNLGTASAMPLPVLEIRDNSLVDSVFSQLGNSNLSLPSPTLVDGNSETKTQEYPWAASRNLNLDLSVLV